MSTNKYLSIFKRASILRCRLKNKMNNACALALCCINYRKRFIEVNQRSERFIWIFKFTFAIDSRTSMPSKLWRCVFRPYLLFSRYGKSVKFFQGISFQWSNYAPCIGCNWIIMSVLLIGNGSQHFFLISNFWMLTL